jgi:hypothetical protein
LGSNATSANTVSTIVARDASGDFSAGTISSTKELVGTTASAADFPNAQLIASQANGGDTHPYNIGVVGEAVANISDSTIWGVGVYGTGKTNSGTRSAGVLGDGSVSNTADTGSAIGVRGYATDTHAGGLNIALFGEASGSSTGNYALAMQAGDILSVAAQNWTLVDNNASALSIGATGKADILKVVSTNAAEGVTMSGTLGVTGIATIGDDSRTLGEHIASRSTSWLPPASTLTTVSGQNGFAVGSSTGYSPVIQSVYYSGDTTAGLAAGAAFITRGATGVNTAPMATSINQVVGTYNWDGYGTTNWTSSLATTNQGAGTAVITPLQMQGYARQAFTDSGSIALAVTGASGTGSVATLTFATQNTAPYVVGQTVAIAGMTPSGYNNAAAVITAATTSSISYANTTTGFTSGGTITATRTVTAAGMGFRVRGFANSTNMTAGNRFNFMDLTASAATFKSAAYTFQNDVITGSTLTATNYMTLGSTGHTIGNVDAATTFIRTSGATAGARPVQFVRNTQTATAAPTTGDGATYRLQTAGSNGTTYNLAEISSEYSSTGDTNFSFNLANGDQTGAVMTTVKPLQSSLSQTVIAATATPTATAGGNTLTTVAIFDTSKFTSAVPIKFPTYTAAAANAITGAAGWQISISNSPTVGGRMAFWDLTNARWSYISDNSAV